MKGTSAQAHPCCNEQYRYKMGLTTNVDDSYDLRIHMTTEKCALQARVSRKCLSRFKWVMCAQRRPCTGSNNHLRYRQPFGYLDRSSACVSALSNVPQSSTSGRLLTGMQFLSRQLRGWDKLCSQWTEAQSSMAATN